MKICDFAFTAIKVMVYYTVTVTIYTVALLLNGVGHNMAREWV